jgi:hypothetical protein
MNSKVEKNYYQIVKQLNWWLGLAGRWYGLAFYPCFCGIR